jgi:hypothetical protein
MPFKSWRLCSIEWDGIMAENCEQMRVLKKAAIEYFKVLLVNSDGLTMLKIRF